MNTFARRLRWRGVAVCAVGLLAGCMDQAQVRQGERFTAGSVEPITSPFETIAVQLGDVSTAVMLEGRVDVDVIDTIGSPVSGVVREVNVGRGDVVVTGDVLFTVDPSPAARLLALELEAARSAMRLAALGDASPTVLAAVEQRVVAAEAACVAAGLSPDTPLPLASVQVPATSSGVVASVVVTDGAQVGVGEPVVEIGEPASLVVRASFDPGAVQGIKVGATLPAGQRDRPGEAADLTVIRVEAGAVASTMFASFADHRVGGDGALSGGEHVIINVAGEMHRNVLWVPPHVIRRWDGRDAVIVRAAGGTTRRVDVVVGLVNDLQAEVVGDLRPGDSVLVP